MGFTIGIIDYGSAVVSFNTLDPANTSSNIALSGGNLTAFNASGGWSSSFGLSSHTHSSGQYYFEVLTSSGTVVCGVGNSSSPLNNFLGSDCNGWSYDDAGFFLHCGAGIGTTAFAGIIGIAVDISSGKIWFSISNGTWLGGGNPTTGTSPTYTGVTGTLFPIISVNTNSICTVNFGATSYTYTPPIGFGNW